MNKIELKAIELARKHVKKCNAYNKSLHASVLFYDDFPIVYGLNDESARLVTTAGYSQNSLHSEFSCLMRFKRKFLLGKLEECDMYNIRITRRGEIKSSKPCIVCEKLLTKYPPRNILYTNDQGVFELL